MPSQKSVKSKKHDPSQVSTQDYFEGKIVGGTLSQMANYSDLFLRMPDPIFLLDVSNFSILETNSAALKLSAPTQPANVVPFSKKLTRAPFLSYLDASSQRSFQESTTELKESGKFPIPFDVRFSYGDVEPRVLELSLCILKLADYTQILQVIAKDVTDLRHAQKELETLSITDEMTTLFNHRHFKRELEKEHARAVRYETPYSVVFIDVDHFKKYNDRNGHPAGDLVLKKVAALLKTHSRNTDLVCRYGGEEFVVLCPGVECEGARKLAEILRATIEQTDFPHGSHQPLGKVTTSLGVASYPLHADTSEAVLKCADDALYVSKNEGRNRVTAPERKS